MGKGESPGGWGRRGVGDALEDSQGCLTQFQTSAERLLGPGWLGLAGGFSGAGRGGGRGFSGHLWFATSTREAGVNNERNSGHSPGNTRSNKSKCDAINSTD